MGELRAQDVLKELETYGTAQNRKIYARYGVGENMYGVSYANLKALVKKIKVNHELALGLWDSGNHDARILATMIADPKQADDAMLDAWMNSLDNYGLTDAISGYISKTRLAREKMEQWTTSADEWIGTIGWNLLSHLALNDKTLPDAYFEAYLAVIEGGLHSHKNRVRYAMNSAVIAIGGRNRALQQKALAAAEHIGEVYVDHGETNCKTPNAVEYIQKIAARTGKV